MIYIIRRRGLGRTSCNGIAAVSTQDIKVVRSDAVLPEANLVFRWGCTATVPSENTVNSAKAIHRVSDKGGFRKLLHEAELCPATWFAPEDVRFPAIVRPQYHSQGKRLWLVNADEELQAAISQCGEGWYASTFVSKVAEYRVYVAQGRAIGVARKYPGNPDAVAWNVAQGGRFEVCRFKDWPLKAVKHALAAHALSQLDFSGVDIMVDSEGNDYVLEINAAPSLTSPYRQRCFAKVFDYMVQHGKEPIPLVAERGGYKKFIHPAICEEALLVQ